MNRRRISNKTTFQFREDDIVKENRRRSQTRTSAQSRLAKYRPSYSPPAVTNLPLGPPAVNNVPRGGRNGGVKEKSGKTSDNKSSDVGTDCICERKLKLVLCTLCGDSFTGRVRKKCQVMKITFLRKKYGIIVIG
jgi:hypothetical protein